MTTKRFPIHLLVIAILVLLAGILSAGSFARAASQFGQDIWRDVGEGDITVTADTGREIVPNAYRTVAADMVALDALLASAPWENTADRSGVVLSLPLPDGTYGRFSIQRYAMMEPELAAKFPEITTYLGQGIDDPAATVRLDRTPAGFHAMILTSGDAIYIDPYSRTDITHYISYFKRDFTRDPLNQMPELAPPEVIESSSGRNDPSAEPDAPSGSQLRTYRAAVAATGEYTTFHGGTVNAGLAAVVTTMNRVSGIYEREVAVRMVLVANNNLIIYTNGATDPYTNNNGGAMLTENQNNLTSVIGSANYDVGHVFSTGGGGVASLGVVCNNSFKARGVTGSPQPVNDPFDVDYVAHELGHQFAANHTFNGTAGNCSGGNRNASTAYEPGSGSTIMAYAGICGTQDLQPNSDDEFHTISFDEIVSFTTSGGGNSCAQVTSTGNTPPVVEAGPNFTIPQNTPFTITGSASDINGDALTYSWEQFNLGPAAAPNIDNGQSPIFRVFPPVSNPSRTFPKLSDLLNNTTSIGEILPTTNRTLTFRLTARDNRVGGGGVNYDTASVTVTTSAGPFLVTAPNTAVAWSGGSSENVTWNVANTTASPVSCPNVNILLSTDGGNSFPTSLANSTPNDGSQSITVPSVSTTAARVKVECANNIFFDISNANFTISTGGPTPTATHTPVPGASMHVGDLDGSSVINGNRWDATVTITVHDDSEAPVSGANVTGGWSAGATGNSSCVTNASGQCSVTKTNLRSNIDNVTFSVSNVTKSGLTYESGSNHDPDADSDGTTIIVLKSGSPPVTPSPTATPPAGSTVHIGDLDGSGVSQGGNRWSATVTVTVHNNSEGLVSGATVFGNWSNGTTGSGSCVTNVSGQCSIVKNNLRGNILNVSFSVTNISSGGNAYAAGDNHDPDGSSNGTVIVISQP